MRTKVTLLIFLLLVITFQSSAQTNESWKEIENNAFSFSIPKSFKKTDVRGRDSFVEVYVAEDIELSFDYGMYSNYFGDWPKDTKFETVTIDGKAARIGTAVEEIRKGFPLSIQVYIKLDKYTAMSMFAACKTEKDVALARRIFETIAFTPHKLKP